MKTFTARDLNEKRQEIREAIQDGGCIVEFKRLDRTVELKALMIPYYYGDYKLTQEQALSLEKALAKSFLLKFESKDK
jgi:hypothetical protein